MKKKITVDDYFVKVNHYDKDGFPTLTEISYDGGDSERIDYLSDGRCLSFYFLSNNRGVRGYEIDGDVRYPLSKEDFERYI